MQGSRKKTQNWEQRDTKQGGQGGARRKDTQCKDQGRKHETGREDTMQGRKHKICTVARREHSAS